MARQLNDVTITHVSYVKRGANKQPFFFAKSEDTSNTNFQVNVDFISKSDLETEEKRLLYGIVYEPDTEDSYGDFMTAEEIEKSAHEFLEYYRNIDTEHNVVAGAGVVVQSYIAPTELTFGSRVVKQGSWVLVTRATEELWEQYKSGEITGYSMFGISRNVVSKGENKMQSFIGKVMEKLGVKKSYEETMNEYIENMTKNPWFIIQMMEEDFYKSINWHDENDEKLTSLVKSLRSAADYIEATFLSEPVAKSEPEQTTETTETTEPEIPAKTESELPTEPEKPAETETEPEKETPSPVQKSQEETIAEIVSSIVEKSFSNTASVLEKQMSDLATKIESITEKVEKIETGSSLRVEANAPEQVSRISKSSSANLF